MKYLIFYVTLILIIGGCTFIKQKESQISSEQQGAEPKENAPQSMQSVGSPYQLSIKFSEEPYLNKQVNLIVNSKSNSGDIIIAELWLGIYTYLNYSSNDPFEVISYLEKETLAPGARYNYLIVKDVIIKRDEEKGFTIPLIAKERGCYEVAILGGGGMAAIAVNITENEAHVGRIWSEIRCPVPIPEGGLGVTQISQITD